VSIFTVEVDAPPKATTCDVCGLTAMNTTGFVYRDGDAFAIYHATLHRHADQARVDLGLAVGSWDADDSVADISAFLSVWTEADEIRFGFVDPAASGWSRARLLGHQLLASEARASAAGPEFIRIAEQVVRDDPTVAHHLGSHDA
jgi:hypothetical protein